MRVLVINANTDPVMTQVIRKELERVKRPDTQVEVVNAPGAPQFIETALHDVQCLPGILEHVGAAKENGMDAIVLACFTDPALEAARELTDLPVVGIQAASLFLAAQLGRRVCVLVPDTGVKYVPACDVDVLQSRLGPQFAGCEVIDVPVSGTVRDPDAVLRQLIEVARRSAAENRAAVFVLGCAGFGYLAGALQRAVGLPVVGPDAAALKTAETLVDLGLSHTVREDTDEPIGSTSRPGESD